MSENAHTSHHSPMPYVLTLGALLVLTGVTVGAAYVDFGSPTINVVIAMFIASIKAALVAFVFMHLRHDKPLNSIIILSSLVFLAIFIGFCAIDLDSRERIYPFGLRQKDPLPAAGASAQPGAPANGSAPAAAPATSPATASEHSH